ncbi:MAG: C_GCAxxG_C_C family protein [Cyanobacteria bacterium SIG31]|nr:C_GCAxxG_C_C family protein [Cyanobacteria bacterium SIG31]
MTNYSQKAVENFRDGYNCAQSVFLAFAENFGFDEETALKLASSFGGGMGRLREVCGAVSSMFAIAGLRKGYISPIDDDAKAKHYELIQNLANEFKEKHGSIICRELLGLDDGPDKPIPSKRTEQYYSERPCEEFIKTAATIIESQILN